MDLAQQDNEAEEDESFFLHHNPQFLVVGSKRCAVEWTKKGLQNLLLPQRVVGFVGYFWLSSFFRLIRRSFDTIKQATGPLQAVCVYMDHQWINSKFILWKLDLSLCWPLERIIQLKVGTKVSVETLLITFISFLISYSFFIHFNRLFPRGTKFA